ncbi:hypothetical protein PAT3040_05259 [Paenibacillus agaridevorans]|uniref:Uncharacterized protein n=1 Tax=Paenibacillus agaridevorans TaxID=171404 RepID=A0A2R5EZK2_9BACL|nr:hypothetical protein PAT3040_05259 [Paenibacillus agaridevorans]
MVIYSREISVIEEIKIYLHNSLIEKIREIVTYGLPQMTEEVTKLAK